MRSYDPRDEERAKDVADYVKMGPGWEDVRLRVLRLLCEAREEERASLHNQKELEGDGTSR